jgi:hypothetical protein
MQPGKMQASFRKFSLLSRLEDVWSWEWGYCQAQSSLPPSTRRPSSIQGLASPNGHLNTLQLCSSTFFFRNGSKSPSLCIKLMHTALFIKPAAKV